jgi:hypothetical protein
MTFIKHDRPKIRAEKQTRAPDFSVSIVGTAGIIAVSGVKAKETS